MSLPGQLLPTDNIIISATSELSDEFPYNEDYNSGDTIGIGMSFIVNLMGLNAELTKHM